MNYNDTKLDRYATNHLFERKYDLFEKCRCLINARQKIVRVLFQSFFIIYMVLLDLARSVAKFFSESI